MFLVKVYDPHDFAWLTWFRGDAIVSLSAADGLRGGRELVLVPEASHFLW